MKFESRAIPGLRRTLLGVASEVAGRAAGVLSLGIEPFSELDHLKPWRLASERIFSALRAIGESTEPHIVGICYRTQHRGSSALNVALLETHYESTFSRSVSGPFDPGSLDLERLCRPGSDASAV